MTIELHPLCTLFPRITGAEFDALRHFSGVCRPRLCIADFWRANTQGDYWHYLFSDASTRQQTESRKPIAGEGVCLLLDEMGGKENWVLTPGNELEQQRKVPLVRAAQRTDEIVYFLRAGEFIKIGKATGSPESRVSQLKTGCPFPIEVIATISGGYDKERALHQQFGNIRAHGEWFHATQELLSFIDSIGVTA